VSFVPRAIHDPDQLFALTVEVHRTPVKLLEHWPDAAKARVLLYSHKGGQLMLSTKSDGEDSTAFGVPNQELVWLDSYRGPLWGWRKGKKGLVSISFLH
jgi:hypothetical protein